MPELPEVETIRRDLQQFILGKAISEIRVLDGRVIRGMASEEFIRTLRARTITGIARRGKAIVFSFREGGYLIAQVMMTGQFIFSPLRTPAPVTKQTKIEFLFRDGSGMLYNDQRLFGRLFVVRDLNEVKFFRSIGPEPFAKAFSIDWLRAGLKKRQGPIKSLLMNQNFIAGIGNIYASEILFRCGIRPQRRAGSLKKEEIKKLYRAIPKVLNEAIECRGTSMLTYRDASGNRGGFLNRIKVYGREEERCYRCRSLIRKIVQAGRSTFFCKVCQA